jgi:hypothetical protein
MKTGTMMESALAMGGIGREYFMVLNPKNAAVTSKARGS